MTAPTSSPTHTPERTQDTPERTQEEAHAWIQAQVTLGYTPTYTEISAWSGRAVSTVGRWVRAWVRDGCDPRVMGVLTHTHTHDASGDGDDKSAEMVGECDVGNDRIGSVQGAIGGLSVRQQQAVELLAGGKRLGEVARELKVAPDTVGRWLSLPAVGAALVRLREEAHRAAQVGLRLNAASAVVLLGEVITELRDRLGEETKLSVPDLARLANAAARVAKIAMEHGGYPRTEHVNIDLRADQESPPSLEAVESRLSEVDQRLAELEAAEAALGAG